MALVVPGCAPRVGTSSRQRVLPKWISSSPSATTLQERYARSGPESRQRRTGASLIRRQSKALTIRNAKPSGGRSTHFLDEFDLCSAFRLRGSAARPLKPNFSRSARSEERRGG